MVPKPFHDRDGDIWYNGVFVPWREANLHVLSHGLHYASCVFEGIRVYNGSVYALTEHSARLVQSAELMGFTLPYGVGELDAATQATVARQGIRDGYVRPVAWRGSEMMGVSAQQNAIHVAIAVWEWPSYFSPEARMAGIRLQTATWRRPSPECAPTQAKAAGLYMICTLSKHAAEAAGCHDALMLDYRGLIAEATGANVFLVIDGKLHTPIPDCFLDGITRRSIINLAKRRGLEVIERAIPPDDLRLADEVFLTGSAAEVTPVGQIDALHFTPGQISRTLMEDYDALVRNVPSQAAA